MQFGPSAPTSVAILIAMSTLPSTMAAPARENALTTAAAKRANMPGRINIGLNDKRYNDDGKSMWTAWVNGADPCHKHTDLNVYKDSDSPCNIRFELPGMDYQYSMQGCGGDLTLWKNGVENIGKCQWAPGHVGCVAGAGYTGQWQCILN